MTRRPRRQAARPPGVLAPQPANRVTGLATENLHAIYDWLTLSDLIAASAVCRQWRISAHSHPTFWHRVGLASGTPAAVWLFLMRIDYHATAPLQIQVENFQTSASLALLILKGIWRQMPRVNVLVIDIQAFTVTLRLRVALSRVLSQAAPRLRKFQLTDSTSTNYVPSQLFGDCSPCLSEVTILGLYDFTVPMPAAVTRVSTCTVVGIRSLHSPADFLCQFPRLEKLTLSARNICHGAIPHGVTFAHLQELHIDLEVEHGAEEFLASPAIVAIPRIELQLLFSSSPANAKFFAPLSSIDLHVLVGRSPDGESISFAAWNEQYSVKRAIKEIPFEQLPSRFLPPKTPSFGRDALRRRIKTISVPLDLLDMIGRWFDEDFPSLETVFVDMLPPEVPFRGGWHAPQLDAALLEGGPGRLTQFSFGDLDFLSWGVLGIKGNDGLPPCYQSDDIELGGAVSYADPYEYDAYLTSTDSDMGT